MADANSMLPVVCDIAYSPMVLTTELAISMPMGDSLCTNGPANIRPTAMRPVIHTSTKMPETPAFWRIDGIH